MRLRDSHIQIIKTVVDERIEGAQVYLFGSRADDTKRGGDIDLYITSPQKPHFLDKPSLLAKLKKTLGQQKIDIVFSYPGKKMQLIDKEAREKGILL